MKSSVKRTVALDRGKNTEGCAVIISEREWRAGATDGLGYGSPAEMKHQW